MKEIAGVFRFGGIIGVEEATYTRSRGIQPGVCQVRIPAEGNPIPIGTTDTMAWGDGENFHYFPGCLVSDVYTDMSRGGSWIITILDRRWMWEKFGQVSGNFNVRKAGSIISATRKNPRKLAEYCLEALGETDYDLSGLPTDIYPEVNWDMDLPGPALESLCRELGCVVCLQLDNSVRICKIGDGAELPKIRGSNIKPGIVIAKMPDEIGFAAAPTTWQVDMELHDPVGFEPGTGSNGKWGYIQSIYKLSYTPKHGWGKEDPIAFPSIQMNLPPDKPRPMRAAAQRSVWKWWRIKFPIELPAAAIAIGPNGAKKIPKITSPLELLPILDHQLEKEWSGELFTSVNQTEAGSVSSRKPAIVFGQFCDHSDMEKDNVPSVLPYADTTLNPKLIYRGGFTIDNNACLVRLSDPCFRHKKTTYTAPFLGSYEVTNIGAPKIYLRAAVNYRDKDTGAAWRWTATMKTGAKNGTPTEWIYRTDVRHEIYRNEKTGDIEDNEYEVRQAAMYYLKAAMQKYKPKNPKEADYSTLPPINLDGAIAQVAFSIDREGYVRSQASRDMEFSVVTPSYEDRQKAMAYQSMLQSNQQIRNAVAGTPKGNK